MNKQDIIRRVNDRLCVTSYPVKQISDSEHSAPVVHAILEVVCDMHGEEMRVLNEKLDKLLEAISG